MTVRAAPDYSRLPGRGPIEKTVEEIAQEIVERETAKDKKGQPAKPKTTKESA